MGPMHIIRIPDGSCGLAMNNGNVEILLPGVHARNSTMFNFQEVKKLDSPLIELGPIHMFIVRSGTAQVCYEAGKVHIFPEGRYAVNSNTFRVAEFAALGHFSSSKSFSSRDKGVGFRQSSERKGSADRPRHQCILIPSCPHSDNHFFMPRTFP